MAYTILIKPDNTAITTIKQTIMQREKLVGKIRVITAKEYNDYDMTEFNLVMSYMTPISKTVRIAQLTLESEAYNDEEGVLSYLLDVDTSLSAENGDVEIQFTFVKSELDADTGTKLQHVRNIDTTKIHVCELADWLTNTDEALSEISKLFLKNQETLKSIESMAEELQNAAGTDLTVADDKLSLTNAKGTVIGNGVELAQLNSELVEAGGDSDGNVKIIEI